MSDQPLLEALRALIAGMEAAVAAGCVEHLDCWDDADAKWHAPLAAAKDLVRGGFPRTGDL